MDPPAGQNVAGLFHEAARRGGQADALVWHGGALTWDALDQRAGGVARALAARAVGAGDRVAIALEYGWPFAAALLGIFKAGAAAAPLHPLLTVEERRRIEHDLTPHHVIDHVAGHGAEWPPSPGGRAALILYTSGSTGEPRGAVLAHEALAFGLRSWAGPVMELTADDVVLDALPLAHSFGLCGALLAPLMAGSQVALLPRFTPEEALRAIARH